MQRRHKSSYKTESHILTQEAVNTINILEMESDSNCETDLTQRASVINKHLEDNADECIHPKFKTTKKRIYGTPQTPKTDTQLIMPPPGRPVEGRGRTSRSKTRKPKNIDTDSRGSSDNRSGSGSSMSSNCSDYKRKENRSSRDPPCNECGKKVRPFNRQCHRFHDDPCGWISSGHLPNYNSFGLLGEKKCEFCGALLFREEKSNMCCMYGKVILPPLSPPLDIITDLCSGDDRVDFNYGGTRVSAKQIRNFRNNIVSYNANLSFAHISSTSKYVPRGPNQKQAPPLFFNGEFSHGITDLGLDSNRSKINCGLFFLDHKAEMRARRENPLTEIIDHGILKLLDLRIRHSNPQARDLKTLREMYEEACYQNPGQSTHVKITFLNERDVDPKLRDPTLHSGQVNPPEFFGETAAIWVGGENEMAPERRGVWVFGKTSNYVRHIPLFAPQCDPLTYVLLFPNGDFGYHWGIKQKTDEERVGMFGAKVKSHLRKKESEKEPEGDFDDENGDIMAKGKQVSPVQWYMSHVQVRESIDTPHPLKNHGRLFQKYTTDYSFRNEQSNAKCIKNAYEKVKVTCPENLREYLAKGLKDGEELGKVFLIPKQVKGSRAYMQNKYLAMLAILAHVQKSHPSLVAVLVTAAWDPNCPEIKDSLQAGDGYVSAPDIRGRVYILQRNALLNVLTKRQVLGKCLGYCISLEFQKRDGPHNHMVLLLDVNPHPAVCDEIICAEFPELPVDNDNCEYATKMRQLHSEVCARMLHDCSDRCRPPGWNRLRCKYGYPHPFSESTVLKEDKKALYKRRRPGTYNGSFYVKKLPGGKTRFYDNSRVVPYNPFLLLWGRAHINVEWVFGSRQAIQYSLKFVLKYVLKGQSHAYVRQETGRGRDVGGKTKIDYDEFSHVFKVLYRGCCEAFLRMTSTKIVELSHWVFLLGIHSDVDRKLYFREGNLADMCNPDTGEYYYKKTELDAYFELVKSDFDSNFESTEKPGEFISVTDENSEGARFFTYPEIVKKWWFRKTEGKDKDGNKLPRGWYKRVRPSENIIGYIYFAPPKKATLFAIRALLYHRAGMRSFEDLRTVEGDNTLTFIDAARKLGLLNDDKVWRETLDEGAKHMGIREMRYLLVQILVFCNPPNGKELWDEFNEHMFNSKELDPTSVAYQIRKNKALYCIDLMLRQHHTSCAEQGLPVPQGIPPPTVGELIRHFYFPTERDKDYEEAESQLPPDEHDILTEQQKGIVIQIEKALAADPADVSVSRLYTLQGSGGVGKSKTLNTIISRQIRANVFVLSSSSTGISATNLYNGVTTHSAFGLGPRIDEKNLPSIEYDGYVASRVRAAQLVIIDEASMLDKKVIYAAEKIARESAEKSHRDILFGGKVILTGFDIKQLLPIVEDHGILPQMQASFVASELYCHFNHFWLTKNLRVAEGQEHYAEWLEKIGRGKNYVKCTPDFPYKDYIEISKDMIVESVDQLIQFTFVEQGEFVSGEALSGRMILALRHVEVNEVNNKILEMLPGEILESKAVNTPAPMNAFDVYQADNAPENLDISVPGSLPEHLLRLKRGAVVFCMVNCKQQNVYNSTLLLVEDMTHYLLHCKILTKGKNFMEPISLSKFNMEYQDLRPNGTHYHFFRQQFPVRLAFALTINKSQSQTLQRVGLYLRQQVFSPGHLYVAFSRVTRKQDVKIFAPDSPFSPNGQLCVRNVVAKDLIEAVEKNDMNFLKDIENMREGDDMGVENSLNSSFEVNLEQENEDNVESNNLGNMNIEEELFHLNEDTDDLENAEGEKLNFDDPLDEEMGIPDYKSQNPVEFDTHEFETEMGL